MQGKLKNVEDDEAFFEDVAGIDTAKRELSEIVDFFNFPERYAKSGARSPRGCLLYGPPGAPTSSNCVPPALACSSALCYLWRQDAVSAARAASQPGACMAAMACLTGSKSSSTV